MENPIRRNLFEIGDSLRKLGENMCQQAQSEEDLNFQKMMDPALLDLFKTLHKFPIDLNEWREEIEKEQKERAEPKVYPKGYVETDEEICAYWDEQEELHTNTRSEIYTFHSIILELIEENLFPKDSDNPTFTFKEALWKIAWELRKIEDLFPAQLCGTVDLDERRLK